MCKGSLSVLGVYLYLGFSSVGGGTSVTWEFT
jgi:hypothetical protein